QTLADACVAAGLQLDATLAALQTMDEVSSPTPGEELTCTATSTRRTTSSSAAREWPIRSRHASLRRRDQSGVMSAPVKPRRDFPQDQ
ncbi:MAG: hypothetical protein ACRDKL_00605, partial [Solirubrobacteraceae bacterium]